MDNAAGVKLSVRDPLKAIYNNASYGPCFGDGDLVISDMAAKHFNSSSRLGTSYDLPSGVSAGSVEAVNHLAGSEYFLPDELEVFHIGRTKYCQRPIMSPSYTFVPWGKGDREKGETGRGDGKGETGKGRWEGGNGEGEMGRGKREGEMGRGKRGRGKGERKKG